MESELYKMLIDGWRPFWGAVLAADSAYTVSKYYHNLFDFYNFFVLVYIIKFEMLSITDIAMF